jgi:hypothetical protein
MGHVDAEAVDPAVEPEAQDRLELRPHLVVRPVQIGLPGGKEVQVPLARGAISLGDPGPGSTSERAAPVVGRRIAANAAPSLKI